MLGADPGAGDRHHRLLVPHQEARHGVDVVHLRQPLLQLLERIGHAAALLRVTVLGGVFVVRLALDREDLDGADHQREEDDRGDDEDAEPAIAGKVRIPPREDERREERKPDEGEGDDEQPDLVTRGERGDDHRGIKSDQHGPGAAVPPGPVSCSTAVPAVVCRQNVVASARATVTM